MTVGNIDTALTMNANEKEVRIVWILQLKV